MSRRHLLRVLEKMDIKPLGALQRPRRYHPETATAVLLYLGFTEQLPETAPGLKGLLVTMSTLKAAKAEKGGAK